MIVIDSSVVVAALIDVGPAGRWAESRIVDTRLAAPHLLGVETSNVLRRAVLAGKVPEVVASQAHRDLQLLDVLLYSFLPVADRVWDLRGNLTAYDAWYVALAEALGVPFATLDDRIARSPRIECQVLTPP